MINQIIYKLTHNISGKTFVFQRIAKLNNEERDWLTQEVHHNLKIAQYIVYQDVVHNITCTTSCAICNKELTFEQIKGKKEHCQISCQLKNKTTQEKIKNTCLQKYGVKNGYLVNQEKIKQENLEKYNVEYYVQSNEFKEKSKKTHLTRYGVENISYLGKTKFNKDNKQLNSSLNYNFINQFISDHKNSSISQDLLQDFIKFSNMSVSHSYKYMARNNIFIEKSESYLETKIKNFLIKNQIEFISNSRNIIKPKEIDIFIPSLNLAIECNGDYWHQVNKNKRNQFKHLEKTEMCESKGIRLLHFWGFEINTKWKLVKYILTCYINKKIPLWRNDILPRDYFSALDFPNYIKIKPEIEKSYQFNVYKTGYLVKGQP